MEMAQLSQVMSLKGMASRFLHRPDLPPAQVRKPRGIDSLISEELTRKGLWQGEGWASGRHWFVGVDLGDNGTWPDAVPNFSTHLPHPLFGCSVMFRRLSMAHRDHTWHVWTSEYFWRIFLVTTKCYIGLHHCN